MLSSLKVSDIIVESSLHGRQRRAERNITKRDLQAAVRLGVKERGFNCPKTGRPRWKYTFCGVVYITDETSTKEVTSWVEEAPLVQEVVPALYARRCEEAKRRILDDPAIITTHAVIVVDMSGSMSKSDMEGHRCRARGVYYNIAERYIAEALPPAQSGLFTNAKLNFTDVISIIEMRDFPTVKYELEPFSWMLFNDLVVEAERKDARSHGNYMPAMEEAFNLLRKYDHGSCALSLFFFSDGKPSDYSTRSPWDLFDYFPDNLYQLIREECASFNSRLTFTAVGFGKDSGDFAILQQMVEHAKACGATGKFSYSYENDLALSVALTDSRTSLTATRTMLSTIDGVKEIRAAVDAKKASIADNPDKFAFNRTNWDIFSRANGCTVGRKELVWVENAGGQGFRTEWSEVPFFFPSAIGFAVSKVSFSEGAERIVFLMSEIDDSGRKVGKPMVAKISLYEHKVSELKYLRRWHKTFAKTQLKAANIAGKFNALLDRKWISPSIPRIRFLPCCIYEATDAKGQDFAFLCEAQLDPSNYQKWNDNTGKVDGSMKVKPLPIPMLAPRTKMEALLEDEDEDEETDDDDEHVDDDPESHGEVQAKLKAQRVVEKIFESDVPQAFSHYSHHHTKRELLVCDLQGELALDNNDPVFKMTDPCIHSRSGKKYGKTDHGVRGMERFFHTHQCNELCGFLGLRPKRATR